MCSSHARCQKANYYKAESRLDKRLPRSSSMTTVAFGDVTAFVLREVKG
ncbi:Hypothetical protein A7982_03063 [Minicystis rosea]|nr:Hypothetical protein A7982_03063 [Minicystis rosea]